MSIEYSLDLAADVPPARLTEVAVAAGLDPAALVRSDSGLLSADLRATHGFSVTIRSARNGYIEVLDDSGGNWVWEPAVYVGITFWMGKELEDDGLAHLLPIVGRVLAARPEDAAFSFNADALLLSRFGGRAVKHNRPRFWDLYDFADALLPG